jgi:hypothetical protein
MIRFELGNEALVFPHGVQVPARRPIERVQAVDRSAAGSPQVEDFGTSRRTMRLVFRGMSADTYAGLEDWFDRVACGAKNPFTFHDHHGRVWQVIIISNPLGFTEVEPGMYEGELDLEVVG